MKSLKDAFNLLCAIGVVIFGLIFFVGVISSFFRVGEPSKKTPTQIRLEGPVDPMKGFESVSSEDRVWHIKNGEQFKGKFLGIDRDADTVVFAQYSYGLQEKDFMDRLTKKRVVRIGDLAEKDYRAIEWWIKGGQWTGR